MQHILTGIFVSVLIVISYTAGMVAFRILAAVAQFMMGTLVGETTAERISHYHLNVAKAAGVLAAIGGSVFFLFLHANAYHPFLDILFGLNIGFVAIGLVTLFPALLALAVGLFRPYLMPWVYGLRYRLGHDPHVRRQFVYETVASLFSLVMLPILALGTLVGAGIGFSFFIAVPFLFAFDPFGALNAIRALAAVLGDGFHLDDVLALLVIAQSVVWFWSLRTKHQIADYWDSKPDAEVEIASVGRYVFLDWLLLGDIPKTYEGTRSFVRSHHIRRLVLAAIAGGMADWFWGTRPFFLSAILLMVLAYIVVLELLRVGDHPSAK